MKVPELLNNATKLIKSNSPEILTGLGVVGVATTSYLVGKASFRAAKAIEEDARFDNECINFVEDPKQRAKEQVKLTWKLYIPAGVSGIVTVTCIIMSNQTSGRRTAAAVAAYSFTDKAFSEYKEKVIEQVGKNKEEKVRADIAQGKVDSVPSSGQDIIVMGPGNHLCLDIRSMRYFRSDYESLRRAENEINFQLNHERYVGLSEFYALIGLPVNRESVDIGWTSDRGLMELDINTTMSEKNEPCLTIDFNYVGPLP